MKKQLSYLILIILPFLLFLSYTPTQPLGNFSYTPLYLFIGASCFSAIFTTTLISFWFWEKEKVVALRKNFHGIGHALSCAYCLNLWCSAVFVWFFGLSIIPLRTPFGWQDKVVDFTLSWFSLGLISLLFFLILNILWFTKLEKENLFRSRLEGVNK